MSFQPDPFANNSPDPFAPTPTDGFEGSYTLATASDNRQYKPTVTGLGMFSAPWPLLLAALCYIGIAGGPESCRRSSLTNLISTLETAE